MSLHLIIPSWLPGWGIFYRPSIPSSEGRMAAKRREESEEGSVNSHKVTVFLSPSHPPFLLKYYHQPLHFIHHLPVFLPQIFSLLIQKWSCMWQLNGLILLHIQSPKFSLSSKTLSSKPGWGRVDEKGWALRPEGSGEQGLHWQFWSWSRAADVRTKLPQMSSPIHNVAHRWVLITRLSHLVTSCVS